MEEMPFEFAYVLSQVFVQMLTSGDLNPLDEAPVLYERAPLFLRQLGYTPLVRTLAARGYDQETINALYPEPPGMEAFRQRMSNTAEAYEQNRKATIRFETQ
jgi:hypothetical protein